MIENFIHTVSSLLQNLLIEAEAAKSENVHQFSTDLRMKVVFCSMILAHYHQLSIL